MSTARTNQIASINFPYTPQDFAEDRKGVRRYARHTIEPRHTVVHLSSGDGSSRRSVPPGQSLKLGDASQWFIDRYGDDPDYLYARYMRFTMLADVFVNYEKEIREAGLELRDGYCKELIPLLLHLRVRPDERGFARFSAADVRKAIREASRTTSENRA